MSPGNRAADRALALLTRASSTAQGRFVRKWAPRFAAALMSNPKIELRATGLIAERAVSQAHDLFFALKKVPK